MRYADGLIGRGNGAFLLGAKLSLADTLIGQQVLQIQTGFLDGVTMAMLEP